MATRDIPALLCQGLRKNYDILGDMYPVMGKKLFHVENSSAAFEQVQGYGGYGLPQVRKPGGTIADGAIFQDFGKKYVHSNYGLKDVIPQEFIDDDVYGMLTRWATSRGGSMSESYMTNDELLAAAYLTNVGFATSLPPMGSPDGVALFSLSHPLSTQNPASLQANRPSVVTDLGWAAIQAGRANLEQQKKANGLTKIMNKIKYLVFNPNQEEIALNIIKNSSTYDTADNRMNTLAMKNIQPFSWPYWEASGATNANAYNSWFLQADQHYMEWYVREKTTFDQEKLVSIRSVLFASFQRQVLGHSNWRGMYGDTGS